ncbi:MAG: type II secretion system F family protein [Lachnospiraceae bacterium]|nr:type II secretion system F family protein [Lachnospiraceae bacterium]
MIIIHILILLIFIILFTLSRKQRLPKDSKEESGLKKPFMKVSIFLLKHFPVRTMEEIRKKQSLLHPSSKGYAETKAYFVSKLSEALLVVFAGNLLGLLVTLTSGGGNILDGNQIARNSYGEGERQVTLQTRVDGEELSEPLNLTVQEQQYTDSEIRQIFHEAEKKIEAEILGDNASLDHVDSDLKLMESVEDYPIAIAWSVDDYEVLNGQGAIQPDYEDKKGRVVRLTAALTYFDNREEYEFFARVYPRKKGAEEEIANAVRRKIQANDLKTVSDPALVLPGQVGGVEVSFHEPPSTTGFILFVISVFAGIVIYYGRDRDLTKKLDEREKRMMLDYPEIVSRLTLLFGAGMTIRGAFEKVAADYERRKKKTKGEPSFAYEEMLVTVREMQSGVSEYQAYQNFGNRAGIRHFNKLGTLLAQNLQKGSAGLLEILERESGDAFEERKALAKKLGEQAGTKLLLPMGMMLLIVMIIVIVPAFLSFSL